ncbi:MAG: cupin domain-containing protein [Polyangiales bacterium]
MTHPEDALEEYALGFSNPDVEAHLAICESCRARVRLDRAALAAIALQNPPSRAPKALRARLLAASAENGRLRGHAPALASLFDLPLEKAVSILDALDAPDGWEEGLLPGMGTIHVSPGPSLQRAGALTHLVKLPAGLDWPTHRHSGEERHLVLEGAITDSRTSRDYRAGETLVSPTGSSHSFHVHSEVPCIGAIVLFGEVEFG